jgi:hypothetical protein
MKPKLFILIGILTAAASAQEDYVQIRMIQPVGVGARANALANNHVALSSGVADLYWNPAALSFSVSREFQGSLYGIQTSSSSSYFGTDTRATLPRFHMGNLGLSIAVPASRGGLSFAFSYSNPLAFDDISDFSGDWEDTVHAIEGSVDYRTMRTSGGLNYWTAGMGLQVAPHFGIGVATSLVTGKEKTKDQEYSTEETDSVIYITDINDDIIGRYLSYDVRLGLIYQTDLIDAGMRIIIPQVMRLKEEIEDNYTGDTYKDPYTMYSSWSGAIGVSATLPFLTISTELRGTLPYGFIFPEEDIPGSSQAAHTKKGAGVGLEVPIKKLVCRVGYSFDDLDLHKYMYFYEYDKAFNWSDGGVEVTRNRHQIATGIGYTTDITSFDIAYTFSTWGITTNGYLEEIYYAHRLLASFALRF